MHKSIILFAALPLLAGCVTSRWTDTPRSASEELLLSMATDRAAEAIAARMPAGGKAYLDGSNFDSPDSKYAIGTIRDALLRHGETLVAKNDADMVIEVRSGVLATDDNETLIGTPSFGAPVPLAGSFSFPKIALYDKISQRGVAKFAATAIDPKTGALVASSTPQYAYSHQTAFTVLLFFSWSNQDGTPKEDADPKE